MRERIRYMHYSLSTEHVYVYWVRFFIRWHGRAGPMAHPRDMGAPQVEAFLTMLATERKVSASTHVTSGCKLTQGGCGGNLGLVYVVSPRLSRYSRGLSEPREILILFSLYQQM